jgi:hypothetical protein
MAVSMKITTFWDIHVCSLIEVDQRFIALMMEAINTSELQSISVRLHGAIHQKAVIYRHSFVTLL